MTDKKIYRFDGLMEEAIREDSFRIRISSKQKEESLKTVIRKIKKDSESFKQVKNQIKKEEAQSG